MVDLTEIADGLIFDPRGYWVAHSDERVSYPQEASDFCFALEDSSFWFRHRNRVIIEAVRSWPPPHGPIFDIGAGNGYVAKGLEEAGFSTLVIEPRHTGAANACRRGLQNVICSTVEAAGFRRHVIGAAGLFDVLEHLEDDHLFLTSLRRLMRAGARIYITVPAFRSLWSAEDNYAGHFRRYTTKCLQRVLERAGFMVEYTSYFFWFLLLPALILRAVPWRLGLRSSVSAATTQTEHALGSRSVAQLMEKTLAIELRSVRARRSIPFGASCLAIAHPVKDQA